MLYSTNLSNILSLPATMKPIQSLRLGKKSGHGPAALWGHAQKLHAGSYHVLRVDTMRHNAILLLATAALLLPAAVVRAQPVEISLLYPPSTSTPDGLVTDIQSIPAGDALKRLFIVTRSGRIWILRNYNSGGGTYDEVPFLDIRDRVTAGGERGLLGLAFHPNY